MQHTILSLPAEIEKYLETLKIGQGRHAGSAFCVLPWQSDFIRGAFGQDDDAALSMARGCGKTTFLSGIMASAIDVDGPLVQPMADCVAWLHRASIRGAFRIQASTPLHAAEHPEISWPIQNPGFSANRATIQDRVTGARVVVLGIVTPAVCMA